VPSPTSSLSLLDLPLSPTMFSPDNKEEHSGQRWNTNVPSPGSSISSSSPYSPAGRGERKTSTQSTGCLQEVDMSNINLQESLLEFTQLQDKIKKEQDLLLDSPCTSLSLDSSLSGPSSFAPLTSPHPYSLPSPSLGYHTVPSSAPSHSFQPLSPDSSSCNPQVGQVKLEPLDFIEKSSLVQTEKPLSVAKTHTVTSQTPVNTPSPQSSSRSSGLLCLSSEQPHGHLLSPPNLGNPLLKQCLQDTSFQTKYNLKPFNFGLTTGFVSEKASSKLKTTNQDRSEDIKKEPSSQTPPVATNLSDVKIEPVLDLAVQQVRKDIETTCEMLSISSDPRRWSKDDIKSWFLWTLQLYNIPMSMIDMELWNMDGQMIVNLNEEDFKQRLPQGGETMYAQFDIWRSNANYSDSAYVPQSCSQESQQPVPRYAPPPYPDYGSWGEVPLGPDSQALGQEQGDSTFSDISYMLQMLDHQNNPVGDPQTHYLTPKSEPGLTGLEAQQQYSSTGAVMQQPSAMSPGMSSAMSATMSPPPYPGGSHTPTHSETGGMEPMEDEEEEEEDDTELCLSTKSPGSSRPGTNIHLWQFVKELLLQPQVYGNYIHWIDRSKGIFKIVDSVKVATLWGKRKNRPAMNYDKLSRSLRQYYKKGIMKKTERSQRLVYQFCHPYHL